MSVGQASPGSAADARASAGRPPSANQPQPFVLLTGLSGAGISTALKAFEDLGHEAVDNLPLSLIPLAIDEAIGTAAKPLAVSVDSRTRGFSVDRLQAVVARLRSRPTLATRLVFVDCDAGVLQRRFTETRRRHPLAQDRPVSDGIRRDRALMAPLREAADLVVDTSLLTMHDLRRIIAGHFPVGPTPQLQVVVVSFAYRVGVPREADLVFDMRFLTNPHWDPELRPLTGRDTAVQRAIAADPDFPAVLDRLKALLSVLVPRYAAEQKSYLTIAIGCSGGKHRSVFMAETLAQWMSETGYRTMLSHRDLPRAITLPTADTAARTVDPAAGAALENRAEGAVESSTAADVDGTAPAPHGTHRV